MITGLLCLVCYAAAAFIIGSRLLHHQGPNRTLTFSFGGAAILLHLVLLSDAILAEPGQNMSMTNVASLVAWLIATSMTLLTLILPNLFLLPVVYGFAALVVAANLAIPNTYIMNIGVNPSLLVHITLALFAYGCLMIALLYALQSAYINGKLKQKQAAILQSSVPPLMAVEDILFKLLLTGTVLLGLSLVSGFMFLDNMFVKEQAHKTLLSLLAFVIFAVVLVGHRQWGWRGKPVVVSTIAGTVLLTLAYFGSRFVREVLLN